MISKRIVPTAYGKREAAALQIAIVMLKRFHCRIAAPGHIQGLGSPIMKDTFSLGSPQRDGFIHRVEQKRDRIIPIPERPGLGSAPPHVQKVTCRQQLGGAHILDQTNRLGTTPSWLSWDRQAVDFLSQLIMPSITCHHDLLRRSRECDDLSRGDGQKD